MFGLIPRRNENNLFHMFDEFEKNFWSSAVPDIRQFRTDIADKGDYYELSAELPGFERDDIHIDLGDGALTISANKEMSSEETGDNYVRRERHLGAFSRSFDLTGIRADDIRARYRNGVLTLELPKQQEQLPPSRQIPIQ